MAFGLAAPGRSPEHHAGEARFRTLDEYRQLMREIVAQGLVDIMLMSASTNEVLTHPGAAVRRQPRHAGRPGQRHDRHLAGRRQRAATRAQPSQPFRTATIDHIQCGKVECAAATSGAWAPTWASTPSPSTTTSTWTAARWRPTRRSAWRPRPRASGTSWRSSIRTPAASIRPADVARFINDHIVRALAGVTSRGRPLFLKIAYHGPAAMEALARYDRSLVVGILGGSAGTTFDAFHMLWEAKKYGARVALYGRKINNAEHQLTFIQLPPRGGRRPDRARRRRSGRITATCRSWASGRTARWPTTCSGPRRPSATAARAPPAASRPPTAASVPKPAGRRRPDFSKMTPGREGPVEPRPLEADRRLVPQKGVRTIFRTRSVGAWSHLEK